MVGFKDTAENKERAIKGLKFTLISNFILCIICVIWVLVSPDTIMDLKALQKQDPSLAKYKLEELPGVAATFLTFYTIVTSLLTFWFYKEV